MLRYLLFLATLCAVQVLALSREKRASAGGSGNAEMVANSTGATAGTGSKMGPAGGASEASVTPSAKPARRAYERRRGFEYKEDPTDLNRPKKSKDRETSSSSGARDDKKSGDKSGPDKESMGMTDSEESSNSEGKRQKDKYVPKSTEERHGWRKWHRKCVKCPSEMRMKWRDPRVKWICGAYQRARRSFKSLCMMHYRNCQDGTMFVMIHEHRCANSTPEDSAPHGEHFMYDYKVRLSADSSNTKSESSESSEGSSSESSE